MTQEVRERHGVKLVKKTCKNKGCKHTFWVSKKSVTKHCSIECQLDDGVEISAWVLAKIRGAM